MLLRLRRFLLLLLLLLHLCFVSPRVCTCVYMCVPVCRFVRVQIPTLWRLQWPTNNPSIHPSIHRQWMVSCSHGRALVTSVGWVEPKNWCRLDGQFVCNWFELVTRVPLGPSTSTTRNNNQFVSNLTTKIGSVLTPTPLLSSSSSSSSATGGGHFLVYFSQLNGGGGGGGGGG